MPDIPLLPENNAAENNETPASGHKLTADETEQLLLSTLRQKEKEVHQALFELACFYAYSGRAKVTKEMFQELLDRSTSPEDKAHYLLSMGQLMEQKQDYQQAVEYYSQAYVLEPADTLVWYLVHNNLGFSLNQLGRHPEAETYCRLAIKIDPERFNAYKNLGVALEGQGDLVEAAHFFIFATSISPEEPRALKHFRNLLEKHPGLLQEYPRLTAELKQCSRSSPLVAERIKNLLNQFNR